MEHLQKLPLDEIAEKYFLILRADHGDAELLGEDAKAADVGGGDHLFPDAIHLLCYAGHVLFDVLLLLGKL